MIRYAVGNIFQQETEALVNSVNCVGVMGRGIALQFKKAYPANFKAYEAACKRNEVQPGRMFVHETGRLTGPRYIINFPTKRHWRGKSRLADIESGLENLVHEITSRNIRSIAVPPLGTNLGGLQWRDVRRSIETALQGLEGVEVIVFTPTSGPTEQAPNHSTDVPRMTPSRAALVSLIRRYLDGLLDPFLTLLELHKLLYFMDQAGQPLNLRFSKGPFGPYSQSLRHVLNVIEGHFISGYTDGGDDPGKQLELVPGAIDDARAFLEDHAEACERLERVADLVAGFESPFGLELLSTVHWVASAQPSASTEEIIASTYAWGPQKEQFSERQIRLALDVLSTKNWLTPRASFAT